MALVYNAADVLLAGSMTEGFGLPIIEAQACGTPVIVTDFASMPELVRWGVAVPPADIFWASGLESWWAWPDWRGVHDALGAMGREKASTGILRRTILHEILAQEFGWDTVVEQHWRPVLDGVAGHLAVCRGLEQVGVERGCLVASTCQSTK